MTPAALRRGIASRITTATNYAEADVLLGVAGAPRTARSPVFDVRLTTSEPIAQRQRSGAAQTIYVRRGVEVRVLTQGNPAANVEQWEAAEVHEQRVRAAVLTNVDDNDPIACVQNAIVWRGADAPEYQDGGAWRLSVQRFTCDYLESLE